MSQTDKHRTKSRGQVCGCESAEMCGHFELILCCVFDLNVEVAGVLGSYIETLKNMLSKLLNVLM